MKLLFYFVVLLYVLYKTAYCKVQDGLTIEKDSNTQSWAQGTRHEIICRGSNRNQQIKWESPTKTKIDFRDAQDSQRIYIQDRTRKGSLPILVLVIKHVSIEDSGVWKCLSGDIEETVTICVIDEAAFVPSAIEISVDKGRAITLTCSVVGTPEPFIIWYKDHVLITDDDIDSKAKYKITTKYNIEGREGLLTILNTDLDDAGLYTCEAVQIEENNDLCYHNDTFNINLYVNYEPTMQPESSIDFPINKVYAEYGDLVHIKCEADGYPEPEYKWIQKHAFHSDIAINSSFVSKKDGVSYLNIIVDDGIFKKEIDCIATNPYGKATKKFKVLPKTIPEVPKVQLVESNDTAILFSLTWDEPLDAIITHVVVMYIEASKLPDGKILKESDWKKANNYNVEWNESPNSQENLVTVDQLQPETKYWMRFRVKNDYGTSRWTKPQEAITTISNEEEASIELHKENVIADSTYEYASDNNMLYAILFLGAMAGIIFVCSIVIKLM